MIALSEPLSVAVLAGGRSRRMGQDKASAMLGGRHLLDHVVARVRQVGDEVLVVVAEPRTIPWPDVRIVVDRRPGCGALGGLHAALGAARNSHCLVVACDMPFLNPALLAYLAELPRDYDALVPVLVGASSAQTGTDTLQTLHAVYAKSCLPAIERRLEHRALKLADLLDDLRVHWLSEESVRRLDPDLRSFFNANTPADLELARAYERARVPGRSAGVSSDARERAGA